MLRLLPEDHTAAQLSAGLQGWTPYLGLAIRQEEIGPTFVLGGPGAVDEKITAHPVHLLLSSLAQALRVWASTGVRSSGMCPSPPPPHALSEPCTHLQQARAP